MGLERNVDQLDGVRIRAHCAGGSGPLTSSATRPMLGNWAFAIEPAAEHQRPNHPMRMTRLDIGLGDLARGDVMAVAQHGVAIAEAENPRPVRCVTKMIDRVLRPSAPARCGRDLQPRFRSTAAVGSSMMMSRDCMESARAISTSCCSATERSRTCVIGSRLSPMRSAIAFVS